MVKEEEKINLRKLQKEEAVKRIKKLTKSFDLSPNILKDFKRNKLSCTIDDYIFNIGFNSKIEEIIKKYENENNELVYYCIIYQRQNRVEMALLSIGSNAEDWEIEREYMVSTRGLLRLNTYIYDLLLPSFKTYYGDITISSIDGALVKVD